MTENSAKIRSLQKVIGIRTRGEIDNLWIQPKFTYIWLILVRTIKTLKDDSTP